MGCLFMIKYQTLTYLFLLFSYLNSMEIDNNSNCESTSVLLAWNNTTWGNQTASRITLCDTHHQPLLSMLYIFPKNDDSLPFIGLPSPLSGWKNWKYKDDALNNLFKAILKVLHNKGFNALELALDVAQQLKSLGVQEKLFQQIASNETSIRIKTDLTDTNTQAQ